MSYLSQRHFPSELGVGTFNVRGLTSNIKKQQVVDDLRRYRVGICCLQETKIVDGTDETLNGYRIICLPTTCRNYGLGFAIHKSLSKRQRRLWSESDRVAVIQIRLSRNRLFSLVNVYVPTSTKVAQDQEHCLDDFHSSLTSAIAKTRSSSVFLVAGDFNAKLGVQGVTQHRCIGRYGRGCQNYSGKNLADFCDSRSLFACTTAFQHPPRHCTTWTGWRRNPAGGASNPIFNQIDYVLCFSRQHQLLIDSRSYAGTITNPDHRLLVARMRLDRSRGVWAPVEKTKKQAPDKRVAVDCLSDIQTREKFRTEVEVSMDKNCNLSADFVCNHPAELWKQIHAAVMDSAHSIVGTTARPAKGKWVPDAELVKMSEAKRSLRMQLMNTRDPSKAIELKHQRNLLSHRIRKRAKDNTSSMLNVKVAEIEKQKGLCPYV